MDQREERIRWFLEYLARSGKGKSAKPEKGVRYPCPCCGYPTLAERGGNEICALCDWEDDGQDDPHAAEVWGGPNADYSLARSRANFALHGHMYDAAGQKSFTGPEVEARRTMIAAFDAMPSADDARRQALWRDVFKAEEILVAELKRKTG